MHRRIIVFGKRGQLGSELVRVFEARGWNVTGLDRIDADVTDDEIVTTHIKAARPDVVVNATAYNAVDAAEREPTTALALNGLAVRNMAVACRSAGARFVHFSTDYVFDGRKGSCYVEEDPTHPIGAYGVSKLVGELYAQAYLDHSLIVRPSGVFGVGGLFTGRGNFVETMLRLANKGGPIRVVDDHVVSPTYAPALADRTADLIDGEHSGTFHIGGGTPMSWFAYAQAIFSVAGISPELHRTNDEEYHTAARRPRYSALANDKLHAAGIRPMPSLAEALSLYMSQRSRVAIANSR